MGMWEPEIPYYKHQCKSDDWKCFMKRDENILTLRHTISECCHDDDYDIPVKACPFCAWCPNAK